MANVNFRPEFAAYFAETKTISNITYDPARVESRDTSFDKYNALIAGLPPRGLAFAYDGIGNMAVRFTDTLVGFLPLKRTESIVLSEETAQSKRIYKYLTESIKNERAFNMVASGYDEARLISEMLFGGFRGWAPLAPAGANAAVTGATLDIGTEDSPVDVDGFYSEDEIVTKLEPANSISVWAEALREPSTRTFVVPEAELLDLHMLPKRAYEVWVSPENLMYVRAPTSSSGGDAISAYAVVDLLQAQEMMEPVKVKRLVVYRDNGRGKSPGKLDLWVPPVLLAYCSRAAKDLASIKRLVQLQKLLAYFEEEIINGKTR